MGKSGGRRRKSGETNASGEARPVPEGNTLGLGLGLGLGRPGAMTLPLPNGPNQDKKGKETPVASSMATSPVHRQTRSGEAETGWRPLKLVHGHDIRLAQMPPGCKFKVLRDIVGKRFPNAKAVLIKYKDVDGDLVTITCTGELGMAESSVDGRLPEEHESGQPAMLRLHVVEVDPDQEPSLFKEECERETVDNNNNNDNNNNITRGERAEKEEAPSKSLEDGHSDVEMDDWIFEFGQLFRANLGMDESHEQVDLHEIGMELCCEALEETVTSEEAQGHLDTAALKFQEVAALALFNWGNVHMCAARKRIPLDASDAAADGKGQLLQEAYEWVKDMYTLASDKYSEALLIKPDFYEGLLALGQQQFELAKLQWSLALGNKVDFSSWDSTETVLLFDSAEEKMKAATEIWEKLEEKRGDDVLKDPSAREEFLIKRRKEQGSGSHGEVSGFDDEAAEHAAGMGSQINLFWGNMLFERSQFEWKLGMDGWRKNLDAAAERFKLAGASQSDVSTVLKNHFSKTNASV